MAPMVRNEKRTYRVGVRPGCAIELNKPGIVSIETVSDSGIAVVLVETIGRVQVVALSCDGGEGVGV